MEILRNMWRRKFRTFLTIFGIVIGIFAFTVMGSMALKLNKMIDGGKRFMTGQITISPKGTDYMSGITATLPMNILDKIANFDGVKAVQAEITMALEEPKEDEVNISMGVPPTIIGDDLNSKFENVNWKTLEMREGRLINANDIRTNNITIGYTISLDKKWNVGDKVMIRGKEFNIAGVLEKTMTGPDSYVLMPIETVREFYVESNPFLKSLKQQSEEVGKIPEAELSKMPVETREQIKKAKTFNMNDVSTMANVSWDDGVDPDELSNRLKESFKNDITVMSPKKMGEEIDKASAMMNAVILGAALLALVVGLFSIVNTMVMSISERTKEIGIKKALGASGSAIAREYTLEAGFIGLVGGIIGGGLGISVAWLINTKMASQGAEIFLIDLSFLLGVVIFSFFVGIVAGVIPAMRAAKLKVVQAIREL